jgi:hypothetical protein
VTKKAERAHVFWRGVPVGALWLSDGDVVITSLEPTAAFAAISDTVRQHSARLWDRGFLQQDSASVWEPGILRHTRQRIAIEALAPVADLAFELRDLNGRALHADFVNVVASPRPVESPVVVVCRKYAHAAVASVLRSPQRAAGDDR